MNFKVHLVFDFWSNTLVMWFMWNNTSQNIAVPIKNSVKLNQHCILWPSFKPFKSSTIAFLWTLLRAYFAPPQRCSCLNNVFINAYLHYCIFQIDDHLLDTGDLLRRCIIVLKSLETFGVCSFKVRIRCKHRFHAWSQVLVHLSRKCSWWSFRIARCPVRHASSVVRQQGRYWRDDTLVNIDGNEHSVDTDGVNTIVYSDVGEHYGR